MRTSLFILFTTFSLNYFSQASLPFSKTAWAAAGTGVTYTAITQRATTSACTGSDGGIFDNTGDRIQIQFNSAPLALTFKLKKQTMSGASAMLVQYSIDGATWSTIGTYGTAGGSTAITDCGDITYNFTDCNARFVRWTYTKGSGNCDIDDVSITSDPGCVGCTAATQPTTLASSITVSEGCTSAQLNFTIGNGTNRLIVMSTDCTITDPVDHTIYAANSTFGSGSEVGGSTTEDFVVYDGSLGTTIVNGLTPGTSYCFKVYEYNGTSTCVEYLTTGVGSTSFTTTSGASCSTPQIRSILVNTCESNEGTDEYFVLSNGSSALNLNDVVVTFPSIAAPYCNSGCGTQTLVNNSSYVTNLNTTAGCSLFQYATTIPANATLIVFTGLAPPTLFNYSSECPGGGPYYVAFCNNTSTTGRFANNAGANRTLSVNFGTSTDAVTYLSNSANTDTNGDYASFDNAGNVTYGNVPTCSAPIPLPMELGLFESEVNQNSILVNWETLSERNLDYFEVQIATDINPDFIFGAFQKAHGTSAEKNKYNQVLENMVRGNYYLRLKNVDFDGAITYSEAISVSVYGEKNAIKKIVNVGEFQEITFFENLPRNSEIKIIDLKGSLIYSQIVEDDTNTIKARLQNNSMHIIQIFNKNEYLQFKILPL